MLAASAAPTLPPSMEQDQDALRPGGSWHTGNLADFRSSASRTNVSGRTSSSAARQHTFSIVFQHVLVFVTAVFSPRCST